MLSVSELKSVLGTHHLRLTKRLGQHHLIDPGLLRRIVGSCGATSRETVVEIGAGLGALTEGLAERAGRVIAVEADRGIAALLTQRMRTTANVEVRCEDILAFSWEGLEDAVVVGAIPYHITSPILVALCEHRRLIRQATLVVQREVGERLLAKPGTKAYGRLSVLGQHCWEMSKVLAVPRGAFYPQPEVDSVCLKLTRHAGDSPKSVDEPLFFAVVKAAFATRRKTLVKCLAEADGLGLTRAAAQKAVRALGLPAAVRGEQLSLEQFAALAASLKRQ